MNNGLFTNEHNQIFYFVTEKHNNGFYFTMSSPHVGKKYLCVDKDNNFRFENSPNVIFTLQKPRSKHILHDKKLTFRTPSGDFHRFYVSRDFKTEVSQISLITQILCIIIFLALCFILFYFALRHMK